MTTPKPTLPISTNVPVNVPVVPDLGPSKTVVWDEWANERIRTFLPTSTRQSQIPDRKPIHREIRSMPKTTQS